jgi:hypothetical protein
LDAYAASHRAVAELKSNGELPKRMPVPTIKYLNNLIEQRLVPQLRKMGYKVELTPLAVNTSL